MHTRAHAHTRTHRKFLLFTATPLYTCAHACTCTHTQVIYADFFMFMATPLYYHRRRFKCMCLSQKWQETMRLNPTCAKRSVLSWPLQLEWTRAIAPVARYTPGVTCTVPVERAPLCPPETVAVYV